VGHPANKNFVHKTVGDFPRLVQASEAEGFMTKSNSSKCTGSGKQANPDRQIDGQAFGECPTCGLDIEFHKTANGLYKPAPHDRLGR
jgi:hypothetical protein